MLLPLTRQHAHTLDGGKRALASHPLYAAIDSLPRLRTFVEHHVACVWDFMSLLKSLQRDLAGANVPWHPPQDPEAARLVNEIVLGEESDSLPYRQGHASHFIWYTEAMEELGGMTAPVDTSKSMAGFTETTQRRCSSGSTFSVMRCRMAAADQVSA